MKITITGINGYLGTRISAELKQRNHEVSGIERKLLYGSANDLAMEIKGSEVIINLAGASILRRWTKKNRELIYDSRIETTRNLIKAIRVLPAGERPRKFISASAIGLYKPGDFHTEGSQNIDRGFLGTVVTDWEKQLENLPSGLDLTIFRIGPVIGKKANVIRLAKLPFQLGLGGKIASGKQPFPFIHETDLVAAFVQAVASNDLRGTFNLVAPDRISNLTFTREYARILNRPAFFTVPAFVLKMLFGKASEMLTNGPEVSAQKLIATGFRFQYPDIGSALGEALK